MNLTYDNLFTKSGKIFFPKSGTIIPTGTIVQTGTKFTVIKSPHVCVKNKMKDWDSDFISCELKPLNEEQE